MSVRSPLREQIAHAIADAIVEADTLWSEPHRTGQRQRERIVGFVAAAVLPLVEAAVDAAAKAQLVESQLWISERAEAIREAERLRLHTLAATVEGRMAEYAATIRRLRSEQPRDEAAILKWDHRWDEARWTLATLRDVLGVAATPQPEEQ